MPKTHPPYPAEFRQQIIELVRAGRTPAELSREFQVTAQTIRIGWVRPPVMAGNRRPARKA